MVSGYVSLTRFSYASFSCEIIPRLALCEASFVRCRSMENHSFIVSGESFVCLLSRTSHIVARHESYFQNIDGVNRAGRPPRRRKYRLDGMFWIPYSTQSAHCTGTRGPAETRE
ncbi:unnamed protein product [Hapterophycus canaliculatus]